MKLNNLSRLMALLMAMSMIFTSVVWAETSTDLSDLTGNYVDCVAWAADMADAGYCSVCLDELARKYVKAWPAEGYKCLYDHLDSITAMDGYTFLTDLYTKYQNAKANSDYTAEDYYYGVYMAYVNGHNNHVVDNSLPAAMCYKGCAVYSQQALVIPSTSHTEGTCPWHIDYADIEADFNAATDKETYVGSLTEDAFENLLDALGWIDNSTLITDDGLVQVVGSMPADTELHVVPLDSTKLNDTVRDFVLEQGGADMSILEDEHYEFSQVGYDVTLKFHGRKIEPKSTLAITYFNARDPYSSVDHVDAYVIHVLESAASVAREIYAGRTVYITDNATLTAAYTGTAATQIKGYEGKVLFTLVTDETSDDAIVNSDGSVTFKVDSLSGISTYAAGDMADTADNFVNNSTDAKFYYRIEYEESCGASDSNTVTDCEHIKTVTYTNAYVEGATNVPIPHYYYGQTDKSGLDCGDVVGYSNGAFADGTQKVNGSWPDTAGAFSIYVETEPGWVVTSYRIGCEGSSQMGENCRTVEAQNLTVVPDENGNYISKITIPGYAKSFGHSSGYDFYVLLLTVEEVSIDIGVTKSVDPQYVTYTDGEDTWLEYEIKITNNSTNNIPYTEVQFEDTFFMKGAYLTSVTTSGTETLQVQALLQTSVEIGGGRGQPGETVTAYAKRTLTPSENTPIPTTINNRETLYYETTDDNGTTEESTTTAGGNATVSNVIISVTAPSADAGEFWHPGETITLKYKYLLTETDAAAGVLPNTVFVTAFYDPEGEVYVEDFNTAYVEVLISEDGFGAMQVRKNFGGLSKAQVDQLVGGDFAITVTPTDTSVDAPTIGTVTKVSDTEYYWNVTGLVVGETYTVTESNYIHADFAAPDSTVKVERISSGATTATTLKDTTTGTSATTEAIVAGDIYHVYFTNTYASGDLAITKQATTNDTETLSEETLASMQFPFIVTFTQKDGTTASTVAYDYTITSGTTEISADKIMSGGVIWLAPGQTATIKGLPLDASYTVTEANVVADADSSTGLGASTTGVTSGTMSYYTTSTAVKDNAYEFTVTASGYEGRIGEGTTQTAAFSNTYGQSTGSLTIIKTGMDDGESAIFSVAGDGYNGMVVVPNGSTGVTLYVTCGDYTITEIGDWTWRYSIDSVEVDGVTADLANKVTVDADGTTVKVTNKKDNDKWLSDEGITVNFDSTEKDGVQ